MKPYYQDDTITIYHGRHEDVLPDLDLSAVALTVTSPPYNLKRGSWGTGPNSIHKIAAHKFDAEWYPDEIAEPVYQAQQRALLEMLLERTRGAVCYNHKVRYAIARAGRVFHPMEWLAGLPLWVEIIWDRGGGLALNSARPVPADERIYVLGKPLAWHGLGLTNIWRLPPAAQGLGHPCPFPLELPARCIRMFTDLGDLVLDPYCGVGTTLQAAKQAGRRAVGVEVDERHCETAARQLGKEIAPSDLGPLFAMDAA